MLLDRGDLIIASPNRVMPRPYLVLGRHGEYSKIVMLSSKPGWGMTFPVEHPSLHKKTWVAPGILMFNASSDQSTRLIGAFPSSVVNDIEEALLEHFFGHMLDGDVSS